MWISACHLGELRSPELCRRQLLDFDDWNESALQLFDEEIFSSDNMIIALRSKLSLLASFIFLKYYGSQISVGKVLFFGLQMVSSQFSQTHVRHMKSDHRA